MKKLNFVLTIIGTLLVAQSIFAQETTQARIGVVDMNKLVQESPPIPRYDLSDRGRIRG